MSHAIAESHPLRRLFAGLTEDVILTELGMADPRLADYLASLLARFVHVDTIYRLRNARGKKLKEVAEMLAEAQGRAEPAQREVHRQIGDFALFWTGMYPEALDRLRDQLCKDHFVDYCQQGKRSYWIASTYDDEPFCEEAPVLRRLSCEFEMCAFGLSQVRVEWEKMAEKEACRLRQQIIN